MNLLKGYNTQIVASTVKSASHTQADIYSGDSFRLDQADNQQADITLSSKATEKSSRHEYVEKQWQQTVFFLYTTVLKSPSINTYIPKFFLIRGHRKIDMHIVLS